MILKKRCMSQGALMQACGHMYLDEEEKLSTGTAKDNLAFEALKSRMWTM